MSFARRPREWTQYGGANELEGAASSGGRFTPCMVRRGDPCDEVPGVQPGPARGQGQLVMVVDDDEALLELTTRALLEWGYEPLGFGSAQAALEALRARPDDFVVLLTDLHMPGMAGDALIREVRGVRPLLPVILISGDVGDGTQHGYSGELADEVLAKPLLMTVLAASLARVLRIA